MAGKARRPRTGRTNVHCLQADEREATSLHPANQENVAPFMPAASANKNTESWPQGGPKNKTAKEYYFWKREVAKTDPKMGPPRGPIFVTAQSKT